MSPSISRPIVLCNRQSPGDILVLTAVIRDLARVHRDAFVIQADTCCPTIWENNPYVTIMHSAAQYVPGSQVIEAQYPAIHRSNLRPRHFIEAFHEDLSRKLGVPIPVTAFKGDIHLSADEKHWPLDLAPDLPRDYWVIVAGGKYDFTAKWWNPAHAQAVVDHFRGKITFVQTGEAGHWHPPLDGVINLVGKTDIRQFIRLIYHASGVVCPVTFAMHLAAAVLVPEDKPFKLRPCVVIAGGREPAHWEQYPGHQFLHTIGMLDCCASGGCWRSRCQLAGDGDAKDSVNVCSRPVQVSEKLRVPQCMQMISPGDVIRAIEKYLDGWSDASPLPTPERGRGMRRTRPSPRPPH